MDPPKANVPDGPSLKDELSKALPSGLRCKVRYVHTPPRVCDPLFSTLLVGEPEKTRLASHFFTISIDPREHPHLEQHPGHTDVISFAVEVLVYTTKRLTTLFVSKVDSTSYTPKARPSPIKTAVTTFLKWLTEKERLKQHSREIVISLFARAQAQYLFPGSSDNKQKHILDDRQLIKWWAKVLDPILPSSEDPSCQYQGYMTIPGYAGNELRSFMPPNSLSHPRWLPGHPLIELARTRGLPENVPPRCLLPRFPDDPKARFMQDLDEEIGISQDADATASPSKRDHGRWSSIRDLERFWEAMEFRQECSSGRVVGFLWLVISPTRTADREMSLQAESQGSMMSQESSSLAGMLPDSDDLPTATKRNPTKKRKPRTKLTGPIIPRKPRLKGGSSTLSNLSGMAAEVNASTGDGILILREGYDKAMQTLLKLDFATLQVAIRSTSKWVTEITTLAGLNGDFAVCVDGSADVEVMLGANGGNGTAPVNDLGGMVRKKRKAGDEGASALSTTEEHKEARQPAVNVLGGGMVRKKPKPTPA